MLQRFICALYLLALLTMRASGASTEPKGPDLALESYTLPNGLKVALHRDPTVPRVTVVVAYHVGSKNEKAGRTGFAHFFEHMMFRGTKNVPNYDIPLQQAGAQSNAFTTEDMTVYFETVPSNFLERALYLEAERLAFLPSALDQSKFDTEREVVKNERRQSMETQPYGFDSDTINATLFPKGHPYSWSVIGSMDDLNHATLDDLKRFFFEFYHPANATLCLAGDFDPAEAKALIQKYFGPLVAGTKPKPPAEPSVPSKAAKIVFYDQVQLPRVYWNWPSVADDHPDSPALELLASVLGGSRLHKVLVLEKRLSNDVSADSDTKESAGLFTLKSTAAEGDEPGKRLEAIESAFADALQKLQSDPPTAVELARAQALYEHSAYSAMTSPLGRAVNLAIGFTQRDDPAYYRKDFDRHFKVTPADLKRVAGQYLRPEKVILWTEPIAPGHPKSPEIPAGPAPSKEPETALAARAPAGGQDWSKIPGPSPPRPFHAPKFVRKSLSNGLEVWIASWKTLPLISVRLVIPSGTADDPKGKSGLATLTAALFDKGTKTKTAIELREAAQGLGITLGADASADDTMTGFSTVVRNLDPALALLGEVLTSPRLDVKDFERERALDLAALKQGPDSVGWIARRAFPVLLYGADHPYGNPAQGFAETVKSLTLDDVRKFRAEHLGPKGAILIAVGDVEPDALLASLESKLGKWSPQAETPNPRPASSVKVEEGVVAFVDKPGAVQSVLSVGRRWVDRSDPRYFATLLGNRILGGDFLSRLNQNLREKNGFTYGAGSAFRFRRTGSVWSVNTQVRADATAQALKEALAELDALAGGKPFTAEEIATARDAEARSYPETFEAPSSIAGALAEMAEFHLPLDYLDTFLKHLQDTGPDAVARTMTEVVAPKERVILIVGDRKTVEPKLKQIGFTRIRPVTTDGLPAKE